MSSFRILVKSKIQRLTVTGKNLKYEGSLELNEDLMRAADILPNEIVQVVDVNNGNRFETYAIKATSGSGVCVLDGAAARMCEIGDEIIVMSKVFIEEELVAQHQLKKIKVDRNNRIVNDGGSSRSG
ncbi:aspartate 1-decarboxylase [candidate division WOR-3 bacterium JGI_Cruoil_03_51_56]|uniref:Aspartate 1-decarboxylase n=1 Tax=candidate division WOR-3 bacterium JGI_Cruoil_03_51_56 TaxID=1973747 RepID=A0A235BPX5_UNCW3|nr:MAG: aspartate 1-decarboxylase [candidate division WOR-3 bacterium JGI_Cruoil_03_51_56]